MTIGCKDIFQDEKYTLIRTSYWESQLETNGYYYTYASKFDSINSKYLDVLFLYKNGIAIIAGGGEKEEMEALLKKKEFYNYIKDVPAAWGIFNIENDSIKIERPKSYGWFNSYMFTLIGGIANDSIIHVIKDISSTGKGGKPKTINQIYHYRKFSPKPDSTNVFIK
ncbi:hypothetical protein MASR2M117_06830 [Paludibacter sp.]|jgi:hypothetical protein